MKKKLEINHVSGGRMSNWNDQTNYLKNAMYLMTIEDFDVTEFVVLLKSDNPHVNFHISVVSTPQGNRPDFILPQMIVSNSGDYRSQLCFCSGNVASGNKQSAHLVIIVSTWEVDESCPFKLVVKSKEYPFTLKKI